MVDDDRVPPATAVKPVAALDVSVPVATFEEKRLVLASSTAAHAVPNFGWEYSVPTASAMVSGP